MEKTTKTETAKTTGKLKITQIRSIIGHHYRKKRTMKALGLKKINHSVIHKNEPSIIGMLEVVKELVKVEEIE